VLLVDDHAFLRDALAEVMARAFPRAQVLQAGTLREAQALLQQHPDIDLLLLDLQLPDGDGLAALPDLRAASSARLVVMSADESVESIGAALENGACGYLPKTLSSGAMLQALDDVMQGRIYIPAVALRAAPPSRMATDPALDALGLSPRQTDVLGLLIEGVSNKVIARELDITEATVKSHLSAILTRFGVASRTQVVVEVARQGWRVAHRARRVN
jgi:DNA-binding NarL/FixJ family response regulator